MAGMKRDADRDLEYKRLALQIVVQLPKEPGEALRVLTLARVLVSEFMMTRHDEPEAQVVDFKRKNEDR